MPENNSSLRNLLGVLLITLFAQPLLAQPTTLLIFDKHQSIYVGANDLLFAQTAIYSLQDRYIPDTLQNETTLIDKGIGVGYRMVLFSPIVKQTVSEGFIQSQ